MRDNAEDGVTAGGNDNRKASADPEASDLYWFHVRPRGTKVFVSWMTFMAVATKDFFFHPANGDLARKAVGDFRLSSLGRHFGRGVRSSHRKDDPLTESAEDHYVDKRRDGPNIYYVKVKQEMVDICGPGYHRRVGHLLPPSSFAPKYYEGIRPR